MPITVNDGGVSKTLKAVTANIGGVNKELVTIAHCDNGGVKRDIFNSNFITFEEIWTENLASGGLTSAQYVRGSYVSASISGYVSEQRNDMSKRFIVRIWFNNIKSGDNVSMECSWKRSPSGTHITVDHAHADFTNIHNERTTSVSGAYSVEYTATTDRSYIDINFGVGNNTTFEFYVNSLTINGKKIFGNIPNIQFPSEITSGSIPGVTYTNSNGHDDVTAACSRSVTSAHALSEPFEWVDSSQKLFVTAQAWLDSDYSGSSRVSLIDNTSNTSKDIVRGTSSSAVSFSGDIDSSWLTVGHSYCIAILADQKNFSAGTYAKARAYEIYVRR